jgi:sugar lactone lactonase YvrE
MKKVKITFLFVLLAALSSCKKAEKIEIEKATVKMVGTFVGSGAPGYVDGTEYNTSFNQPLNLSTDIAGNIYVADQRNHCIRKITPSGIVTTVAGNGISGYADGISIAAQFNNPCGVTVDATGNLYVADSGNNCIRKISPTGVVTTLAGAGGSNSGFMDGTGTNARFNNPIATCIDGSGNLIVADLYNNRLRKITTSGVVTTLLGNGSDNFQDGPISAATTPYPTSVVYDPTSGNIYISQN